MTLNDVPVNREVTIRHIGCTETELLLLRFGLGHGDPVRIKARPPGGPVVMEANGLSIALGRQYCPMVEVC